MGEMADQLIDEALCNPEGDAEGGADYYERCLEELFADVLWKEFRPLAVSRGEADLALDMDPAPSRDKALLRDALARTTRLAEALVAALADHPDVSPIPSREKPASRMVVRVQPGTPKPAPLPPAAQPASVPSTSWLNNPHRPMLLPPMTREECPGEANALGRAVTKDALWTALRDDPAAQVTVYTDGSGTSAPNPCACGALVAVALSAVSGPAERLFYGRGYSCGPGTNNVGELQGILKALALIPEEFQTRAIEVRTDSQYVIGACMGNKANSNIVLVETLRRKVRDFSSLSLRHVPGHAGLPGNELADKLAGTALHHGHDVETNP